MAGCKAERARTFKARQRERGLVRVDLWLRPETVWKLHALCTDFDGSLGVTVDRLIARTKLSEVTNLRASMRGAPWDARFPGNEAGESPVNSKRYVLIKEF